MGRNRQFGSDPEVARFRGQVVMLTNEALAGTHPDFTDASDRYYVSGRAEYSPPASGKLRLQGIPGHTNGSLDGVTPDRIRRAPKGKLKKWQPDL